MEQTFENMQLNRSLVAALKTEDITIPTEIQQKVIPVAQQNIDLIFQSETGTGKTLAYLLPLFEKIETQKKEMQALILVPTHELAIQVIRQIEMLSLNSDLKATSTPVIGDVNITRQIDKLRTKPHIIVGTAGRILELIQKKKISAHTVKTIIIDEADRLLDDNNIESIKAVIKTTLKERQMMMCSASMSSRTIERAKLLMKAPQIVKSKTAIEVPDTIEHLYFVAEQRDKIDVLRKLVRIINPPKAIAFFANAEDIAEAAEELKFHKLRADSIHGSNIKSDRKKTMDDFRSGKLQLLIASDIAARGLDIEGVTHIFNVNIPERAMDYLHRAGRTGRNGSEGVAISIAAEHEIAYIKQFEKELRISVIPKSMYNGKIVEYRKQSRKLDSTSEFEQRKKYVQESSAKGTKDTKDTRNTRDTRDTRAAKDGGRTGDKPAAGPRREERPETKFRKTGGKLPFKNRMDGDKTERKVTRPGDKADTRYKREGPRPEKSFTKDGAKPAWKPGKDNKSKPEGDFKKKDNRSWEKSEARFKKDQKKSDGVPFAKFRTGGKTGAKSRAGKKPVPGGRTKSK